MLVFGDTSGSWENVLGMISGTSACHMLLNKTRVPSKGIWGPYKHSIVPDYYLREAGQSATGKLIDDVVSNFFEAKPSKDKLVGTIKDLNRQLAQSDYLHKSGLLVNPSFHGNRSPIGNYDLKGAFYGMTLEKVSLLDLYVSTVESLAYETKFILEAAATNDGRSEMIRKIIVTGGLVKNDFYMQSHADILGCPLVTFSAGEADLMLVGASLIAYTATHIQGRPAGDTKDAINGLLTELESKNENVFKDGVKLFVPRNDLRDYHEKKYRSYRKLLDCCLELTKNPFV